jgi:transcription antitermination protein NusB
VHPHRKAREVALQVLYQDDLNPRVSPSVGEELLRRRLGSEELQEFGRSLVAGVRRNRAEIDAALADAAEHWSLGRMAATDRNILRLGAHELLHTDTPPRVAIDEAIELARRYGSADSSRFVNGILDRLMHAVASGADVAPGTSLPEP